MTMDLRSTSLAVITGHQHPGGAFPACPTFPTYRYSWLRDGSFIAYALDRAGHHASAARFHSWVARTVLAHRDRAEAAIRLAGLGISPGSGAFLHCRYTVDGQEGQDEGWNNYQVDGYGAWLWAVREHLQLSEGELPANWRPALRMTADYVAAVWAFPSVDCWEENTALYPATLACLYGGLMAAASLLNDPAYADVARQVRTLVLQRGVKNGRLVKHFDSEIVDASLLWVSTPFRLLEPTDPVMVTTVQELERACVDPSGGVHRFPGDSYYGGGAWLLLTAWLGWYRREVGQMAAARSCLRWIEQRALPSGEMPEQVAEHLYEPGKLAEWEERWGQSACPLLWSHAMHLVLQAELG